MEKILTEILETLKRLESKIDMLSEKKVAKQTTTTLIRDYITKLKNEAKANNQEFLVLVANDIHSNMHLNSKMPMVCNAMYQSMQDKDEVLYQTESGYSSTLKIKYYL